MDFCVLGGGGGSGRRRRQRGRLSVLGGVRDLCGVQWQWIAVVGLARILFCSFGCRSPAVDSGGGGVWVVSSSAAAAAHWVLGAEMGGVCSAGIPGDRSPAELSFRAMGLVVEQELKAFPAVAGKVQGKHKTAPVEVAPEPDPPRRLSPEKAPRLSTGGGGGKARRSVSKEPQLVRSSSEKLKAGKSRTSTSGKASLPILFPPPFLQATGLALPFGLIDG